MNAFQSFVPIDVAGSIQQGMDARNSMQESDDKNALRAFIQQNGAAIQAGDKNVIGQLFSMSPELALEIQDKQLGMENTRGEMADRTRRTDIYADDTAQRLKLAQEEGNRQGVEFASKAGERDLAEMKAKLTKTMVEATQAAGSQATWDTYIKAHPDVGEHIPFDHAGDAIAHIKGALDAFNVSGTGGQGLVPQFAMGADKQLHGYQLSDKGGMTELKLPEGQSWAPGVNMLNTGTEFIAADKRTGQPTAAPIPIDNAGKAADTEVGTAIGQAKVDLPNKELAVNQATALIDKISGTQDNPNPALPEVTGSIQGRLPAIFHQDRVDTVANIDELTDRIFPQAIDFLVGKGAMSNMEGMAAKGSISNLRRYQGTPQFVEKLQELKQLLQDKLSIVEQRAGGVATPAPAEAAPSEPGAPISDEDLFKQYGIQ